MVHIWPNLVTPSKPPPNHFFGRGWTILLFTIFENRTLEALYLEHNLFKNVSKGPAFFVTNANSNNWMWSQYDTDKNDRWYTDTLLIYTLSTINFQKIWMLEVIFTYRVERPLLEEVVWFRLLCPWQSLLNLYCWLDKNCLFKEIKRACLVLVCSANIWMKNNRKFYRTISKVEFRSFRTQTFNYYLLSWLKIKLLKIKFST